jgi:Tetratricopeptide repeat
MPDLPVPRRLRSAVAFLVAVAAAGTGGCSSSKDAAAWKSQNAYGSEMARKGFWREALFRYEKAAVLQPDNAEVQNNLGVAFESVGETSRALAAYKKALELAPQDQKIKRNYARFAEYYTSVQRASSLPAPSSSSPPVRPSPTPAPETGAKPGSAEPPLVPPSVGTVPSGASPGTPIPPPAQNPPSPPPAPTPGPGGSPPGGR